MQLFQVTNKYTHKERNMAGVQTPTHIKESEILYYEGIRKQQRFKGAITPHSSIKPEAFLDKGI